MSYKSIVRLAIVLAPIMVAEKPIMASEGVPLRLQEAAFAARMRGGENPLYVFESAVARIKQRAMILDEVSWSSLADSVKNAWILVAESLEGLYARLPGGKLSPYRVMKEPRQGAPFFRA